MKTKDIFNETYTALSANKVRSGLTMLGIVIGISSVIAMVSIGQGAQSSISASIQSIGSNLIMVYPGAQRTPGAQVSTGRGAAKTLTQADADAIRGSVSLAKAVAPELSGRYQVTAKGKNTNTTVDGVDDNYPGVRNVEISEGDFISSQNVKSLSRVAVLGPTTRDDLFGVGWRYESQRRIGIRKPGRHDFHSPHCCAEIPGRRGLRFDNQRASGRF